MDWYNYTWNYVVKMLKSDVYYGIRENQIEKSREQYGSNKIEKPKIRGDLYLILKQFKNIWFVVFLASEVVLIYQKEYILSVISGILLIINIAFLLVQERNKFKGIKEIDKLNDHNVSIIREGKDVRISVEELVVGDIVYVNHGSIIPADLRVIKSDGLKVKESAVTGEKYVVEKYETKIEEREIQLSEMKNMLFKSSYVVEGEGVGVVTDVGMNTKAGKTIGILLEQNFKEDYFNEKLNRGLNILGALTIVSLIVAFIFTLSKYNRSIEFITLGKYISLICTCQTFIITMNLVYLWILSSFKKQNIFIKNLSAIYKMCDISIMAFEKQGSISENTMEIRNIYINDEVEDVNHSEFNVNEDIQRMLTIGLLCNDSKYDVEKDEGKGELEDIELIKFSRFYNILKRDMDIKYTRILQIPFDSDRKIMTTINKIDENYRANIKGALDYIIDRCTHIMVNGVEREITKEDVVKIKDANINMCGQCLNVVAFASRAFSYEPRLTENIESNLVFQGLMGFYNPLKEDYSENLNYCSYSCIKPIIITKDNKLTAYSIAKKIRLITNIDAVVSGVEVKYMSQEELEKNISKVNILSNVDHVSKSKVAETFKNIGYKIAMCGSNLKDLAYLVYCDISIGMGKGCSNTIKKISDMFIEDFSLNKFIEVLDKSKQIKLFFESALLYILYTVLSQIVSTLFLYKFNGRLIMPVYSILWLNLISVNILLMALFIQCKYMNYVLYMERLQNKNFKVTLAIKAVIFGIVPVIVFNAFSYKGISIASKASFGVLNLMMSILMFSFTNESNVFFENKVSNVMVILNIILGFLVFLI